MPWMIYDSGNNNHLVTWQRFATFDDAHGWVERSLGRLHTMIDQGIIKGWTYVRVSGPVRAEDIARGWWSDEP